ncbi:MAG: adenylyltransferase/cytidyltransferase family protein, partial [Elusimicrobiota bacterium]|nr:adenylyltransferase/cytidyltransferase family protein [Elusimicrobiota bacterium]
MKKVLTFGVFDFFHLGHLRLFKNILKMGGGGVYLIVAVQQDNCIKKYKPDTRVLYSTQERIEILKSIREIDEVIVYTFVDESIKHIDFDILAIGSDQTNP